MKIKNLPNQTAQGSDSSILFCYTCGGEYSANAADYNFNHFPNFVLRCCGTPLELVIKRIVYEKVK